MGIDQEHFEELVRDAAYRTANCDDVEIKGTEVNLHWHSSRGLKYTQGYDFNDNGEITGKNVTIKWPLPPSGSIVPRIFHNRVAGDIQRYLEEHNNC